MTNPKDPARGGSEDPNRKPEGEELSDLHPGSNPRDAQEEAKALRPNEDTREQEERSNILEHEFEAEDERELDQLERQHPPLTDPEDNAKVDRLVDDTDTPAHAGAPRPRAAGDKVFVRREVAARDYLVSANVLRNLFVVSGILGAVLVTVILTLASANDSARYTPADETQYQRTLTEATEALSGFSLNGDDGQSARIPIEQAMAVLAAQGLEAVSASLAAAPVQTAPEEPDPQDGVVQPQEGGEAQAAEGEAAPQTEAAAEPEQPAQEPAQEAAQEPAPPAETAQAAAAPTGGAPEVLTAGQAAYEANCASCHQADGAGIAGAFPPVAGHAAALYNAEGGRSYLINLLLYGLQGEIQIEGQTYNGVMPPWQQLSDEEIADILNYIVTAWDGNQQLQDFSPFEAAEVTELRATSLTGNDVYALRQELGLTGEE